VSLHRHSPYLFYLLTAGVEVVYFHLITLRHTTVSRTPLDEGSARHRDLHLTTQHPQETNIHAPGGFRTHDPSKRSAADLCLRLCGHWDRRVSLHLSLNISNVQAITVLSKSWHYLKKELCNQPSLRLRSTMIFLQWFPDKKITHSVLLYLILWFYMP
jgi:hypothetical protein